MVKNMFDSGMNSGKNYVNNLGRGRKLNKNEFIDDLGYIRRGHYSKKTDTNSVVWLFLIFAIVMTISKYWLEVIKVCIAISILAVLYMFARWKKWV